MVFYNIHTVDVYDINEYWIFAYVKENPGINMSIVYFEPSLNISILLELFEPTL